MARGVTIAVGAAVIALAGLVVWRGAAKKREDATALTSSVADASVTAAVGSATTNASDAALLANGVDAIGDAAATVNADLATGALLPDGGSVPALPERAPRSVRFGVVLVTYRGAQDAPADARSKDEARAMAEKLAQDARADFHGAVVRGDSGSIDDLGRVPRGVLEPAPEYVLFTLKPGAVSEPLDTPRGFWIVKRLD